MGRTHLLGRLRSSAEEVGSSPGPGTTPVWARSRRPFARARWGGQDPKIPPCFGDLNVSSRIVFNIVVRAQTVPFLRVAFRVPLPPHKTRGGH